MFFGDFADIELLYLHMDLLIFFWGGGEGIGGIIFGIACRSC